MTITEKDGRFYVPTGAGSSLYIFDTRADAEGEVAFQRRRAESLAREASEKAAAEKAEMERLRLDGFGATLPPMARAKAAVHLYRQVLFRGSPATWREVVRTLVGEGRFVESVGGEWRLVQPGGPFLVVSKTAADYARFLSGAGPGLQSYPGGPVVFPKG